MRTALLMLVLAACNSHENIPVGATVVEGTYLESTSFGHQSTPQMVILYLDQNGVARQESFDIGCSGSINVDPTETVRFAEPLYPGNRFKIEKASASNINGAYVVTKLE